MRALRLKHLFARGPEAIEAEKVYIREFPLEELGLTPLYILVAGVWLMFADEVVEWVMGMKLESPVLRTLRGINFITTSALVEKIAKR